MAAGAGLGFQLIPAALQAGLGTFQYLNAINQAKKNVRPLYSIDPTYGQNIDILTNTIGLPQSALDLYYRNIGQRTNKGIDAINSLGGNANDIASLIGGTNSAYEDIALQDALQKKQDIGGILAARLALADQKDKAWQVNKFAPYADKSQAIANEKVAGLNNIFGALGSVGGAFANQATSKLADSLSNTGFNATTTGTPTTITTPNSGVNTNAIIAALTAHANQAPQFPTAPNYGYNQYVTSLPPDNNLDYQAWFNKIFGAQGLNQQTNQYQYGQ